MKLTEAQIVALAPDEASKKAGQALANSAKWNMAAFSQNALWGLCAGSGATPYQTQIDLQNLAFKCSCPSRKFPCKHGLALLLLYNTNRSFFSNNEQPKWVTDWLEKRLQTAEKKLEKKEEIIDVEAQKKRKLARYNSIEDGIAQLQLWLKDCIRNGIMQLAQKPTSYFATMQKNLIDAKAPGLANMVKNLGQINFFKENWEALCLQQILNIYVTSEGFLNKNRLNNLLQKDIDSLVGIPANQEELKTQNGIEDHWFVLAKIVTEEENIRTEKYWLQGCNSKKLALVLQFIIRGQGSTITLAPGICIEAELVFFESNYPLRALIKRQKSSALQQPLEGCANWNYIHLQEIEQLQKLPFLNEKVHVINNAQPILHNKKWYLTDDENNLVAINDNFEKINSLLAITGGKKQKLVVVGKENSYNPLGVFINQTYYYL